MTSRAARAAAAAVAIVLAAPGLARAGRPDDGEGLFAFDPTDVVEHLDGPAGVVRVHYSVDGPNETDLDDDDGTGLPDFPEEVAATAEAVLEHLAETGFRAPVAESAVGLEPLGGTDAFDFYLVDFGGAADGNFAVDACSAGVCAGHMIMENDFRGYGYPSISTAIGVLTSHELFHAVQAAYVDELPVWASEGTATWAERHFDPGSADFMGFASRYLEDTERSIDRPPVGPVPAFAYGTALFFDHLTIVHGTVALTEILDGIADGAEPLDAIEDVLAAHDDTLADEWLAFGAANLATGPRAGAASFYPYAERIDGIVAAATGPFIRLRHRFYPLATSYFLVEHDGGPLWFGTPDDPTGLAFDLHPSDGGENGEVGDSVASWAPATGAATQVADLPAGDYWLRGALPTRADESQRIELCVGPEADVLDCAPAPAAPDAGVDAGEPEADAGLDAGADAAPSGDDGDDDDGGGCGCTTARTSGGTTPCTLGLLAVAMVARRRRSRRA